MSHFGVLPDDEFFHQNVQQAAQTKEVLAHNLPNSVASRTFNLCGSGAVCDRSCCKDLDYGHYLV